MKGMVLKYTHGSTIFSVYTQSFSNLVSDAHTLQSGSNLSDHFPLLFKFHVNCLAVFSPPPPPPSSSSSSHRILWSKVSDTTIENYQNLVSKRLPNFPSDIRECSRVGCCHHSKLMDDYAHQLVSTLLACSKLCFPSRSPSSRPLVGWRDFCQDLKQDTDFWYRVWREAGCPPSLVFFIISRRAPRENINHLFVVLSVNSTGLFVKNLLKTMQTRKKTVFGQLLGN